MKTPRTLKMPPQVEVGLKQQREKFKAKFGRDPGPDDPVFFDPDCDTPTPITPDQFLNLFVKAAKSAGIDEDKARQLFEQIPNPANANRFPNTDEGENYQR